MRAATIPLTLLALGLAGAATAQSWPSAAGRTSADDHRLQVERHRYETERLRFAADQREALTRQLQIETRLNLLEIEAARRPEPVQPEPLRALRRPEEERALRLSAEARRATAAQAVGQIDAWLDRTPR